MGMANHKYGCLLTQQTFLGYIALFFHSHKQPVIFIPNHAARISMRVYNYQCEHLVTQQKSTHRAPSVKVFFFFLLYMQTPCLAVLQSNGHLWQFGVFHENNEQQHFILCISINFLSYWYRTVFSRCLWLLWVIRVNTQIQSHLPTVPSTYTCGFADKDLLDIRLIISKENYSQFHLPVFL